MRLFELEKVCEFELKVKLFRCRESV